MSAVFSKIKLGLKKFFLLQDKEVKFSTINKFNLIIFIVIDIFLIINIFSGLNVVTNVVNTPRNYLPCKTELTNTRTNLNSSYDEVKLSTIKNLINKNYNNYNYSYYQSGVLIYSEPDPYCKKYENAESAVTNDNELNNLVKTNNNLEDEVKTLRNTNATLENQYNSTLLEKIADQNSNSSINQSTSKNTKTDIENNKLKISSNNSLIASNNKQILKSKGLKDLTAFVNNDETNNFIQWTKNYEIIYSIIVFLLQVAFLLPLILVSLVLYKFSQKKGWVTLATIFWNIYALSFIHIVVKILNFLQFSYVANLVLNILGGLVGGLYFLINYLYIILIPLFGFIIIQILQKTVFSKKRQERIRATKNQCTNCSKPIHKDDTFCGNCGTQAKIKCPNCGAMRTIGANHCQNCGLKNVN